MKKLYDKEPVWFAVIWIIVYVLAFGNADSLSEAIGFPKLLTCIVGFVLSVVLFLFIRRNKLMEYYGLCGLKNKNLLFLIPMAVITSVNFWSGVTCNYGALETLLFILSMCFVGFLEELIFRGLLFKAMCKTNLTTAVIVSSLTFGAGHIVNLLLGEPVFETALQLVYASAIGFFFTAVFLRTGSLLPCIVSHILVNATSAFARSPSPAGQLITALVQTLLGLVGGLWLLHKKPRTE